MSSSILIISGLFTTIANAAIYAVAPPAQFNGPQSGIGSWFQTNEASSFTSGTSWCGNMYSDDMPLFAPSLALMGGAVYPNPAWKTQTQTYCGREINATNPKNGKSMLLYIGDSFAQPRSDGSIDIVIDAFTELYGSNPNGDHDDVMQPVNWEFTGNVDTAYTASGAVFSTVNGGASPMTSATATTLVTAKSTSSLISTSSAASEPSPSSSGGLGAKCSLTIACQSPYTCLSPDGVCKDAACNWG